MEEEIGKIVAAVLKPQFTLKSEAPANTATNEQNATYDPTTGTYNKCPSDMDACDFKGGAKLVFFSFRKSCTRFDKGIYNIECRKEQHSAENFG